MIHTFAVVDNNYKVISAKFDIKDDFWQMNATEGEEWNFCHVLPQPKGEPVKLVIPISLQMGWVDSSTYFCAALEMAQDLAMVYPKTVMGTMPVHKSQEYT